MSGSVRPRLSRGEVPERRLLSVAGGLPLAGFVLNAWVTSLFHPSGSVDDHEVIFRKYADSGGWIATHFAQFVAVLIALAGLLVLYRVMRSYDGGSMLARLGAGATVMTAAVWAVLQGLDGIALKQAVDSWVDATGSEQAVRFANAETLRWTEWGFQGYFRFSLGLALGLFGAAILVSRLVPSWLGWVVTGAGALYVATGIDVGYSGLDSSFGDVARLILVLVTLIFAVGLIVAGRRGVQTLE
jgi:hypothetical protein